jgi:hypothetical protein
MFRIAGIEPGSIEATFSLSHQLIHPDDREAIGLVVNEANPREAPLFPRPPAHSSQMARSASCT